MISGIDFVTPLCSQVTYEGLLDDMFGIQCGYVEFGPEITQKEQPVKVRLHSEDQVVYTGQRLKEMDYRSFILLCVL